MDENCTTDSSNSLDSNPNETRKPKAQRRLLRWLILSVILIVLAVGVYSLYVAVHEPDPQETVVLGQTRLAAGSPAALRIVVRNRSSSRPIKAAEVTLGLRNKTGTVKLGVFRTDATGSLGDPLVIPNIAPGEYELVLESKSSVGKDRVVAKVQIEQASRILLSSDKPIYQPGQTLHLRTLTLNSRTQKPFAGQNITFEVKDPKGNKVFKETRPSSEFGIASADFVLASELNLGRYEISATAGAASAEQTVEVKPYVLPKFKIHVTTDQPYYLPGQIVAGSIQASYFFGRPVGQGAVKLTAATLEEKPVIIAERQGRTDASGKFSFQFPLPDFFTGMPQKNEQAFLDLQVELRDAAQHLEQATLSLCVARSELELTVIPEAGAVVPNLDNMLYVLSAYPDGRPAVCKVFLDGTACQSDAQGVSEIRIAAADTARALEIQAIDSAGHKAAVTYRADTNGAAPAFLLRTDKAVYRAGENARLTVLSPEKQNTVFIDVIKERQTVLTKSAALQNHKAVYDLSLPPSLVGALKVNAYVITQTGEDRGCSRIIYVNPASGLHVATSLSKDSYRPGEVARLDLSVTDVAGRPAPAALGIVAVDESVFALAENRPGLLQQLLEVEGELLKPRYQIKSFQCPADFLTESGENQAMARAYFATLDERPVGPGIGDLLASGEISPRLVEAARGMRGTPIYEEYRNDPRYAGVISLLEGGNRNYDLRQSTGPVKAHTVEAHRRAYFMWLKECLQVGFFGLLFVSPVLLLIYYARPRGGLGGQILDERSAGYFEVAETCYNLLAVLTLLPLVCYPIGLIAMDDRLVKLSPWSLLIFEAIAVFGVIVLQLFRMVRVELPGRIQGLGPLRLCLASFLIQFAVLRGAMAYFLTCPVNSDEGWMILLVGLASLVAPLILLALLHDQVHSRLAAQGIILKSAARHRVLEVSIIMAIVALLWMMLLPALAKAKARAQSISFLNDLKQLEYATQNTQNEKGTSAPEAGNPAQPRVRRDFPETLLWRPELITDDHGKASLEIPLADSITTWHASIDGISAAGNLGSTQVPITVFQDFFVDLDLPVSMTLGDQVSVPLTCYNYLKKPQDVSLKVSSADWFECTALNLGVHLEPNEVKSVSLPIKVLRVGNHSLRVAAKGASIADAIEREIRVLPAGERIEHTRNDALKSEWTDNFTVPPEMVPDSWSLVAKFYPSRFSEIVEGLDSIFQAPYGCFEQTSSTTYPNVLVLNYLKRMGRLTPETEIRARKFINAGYQRLLTFEVLGGGFEWFGRPPANVCLTAYGVLEFTDMARVHPVDEQVTERARQWLFGQQNNDGAWDEIHRGWTWAGRGSMTAFVAWALAEAGDQSVNLDKALSYLRAHPSELTNAYSKALAANAFLAHDRNDPLGRGLAEQLQAAAIPDKDQTLHWTSGGCSVTYSGGEAMAVETTALSAMALMKAGLWPQSAKQALTWISREKEPNGTWGSTQATILAMRALLAGSSASLGQEFNSAVTLLINGKSVETFRLNKENSDVMKELDLTRYLQKGENRIEFRQDPAGELPFQLAGVYWLPAATSTPASPVGAPAPREPLQIDVRYDRTTLPVNEQLNCTVAVKNNTGLAINMAIVDLGIPPGFAVDSSAFEAMQEQGKIAKFEVTGNQVILYLRDMSNLGPFEFGYNLRAKYPLRVQAPPSTVYEYYQPKNRAQSKPVMLESVGN